MPIFEYKCNKCGNNFEVLQGVGKDPQRDLKCPSCGAGQLTKLISSPFVKKSTKSCCGSSEVCGTGCDQPQFSCGDGGCGCH
ncbi:FmdB family zinc ribbon protein [Desulfofalx alkaliphila]|uniref:FmdB family zinc ribbon protein n=1 Tax=Desulfofalx alkaliphila TaxID=105483 RepID=UPI000555583A|nr:zinc ribbon domain-containing protein [Desulfofalx alkaliphila]